MVYRHWVSSEGRIRMLMISWLMGLRVVMELRLYTYICVEGWERFNGTEIACVG